MLTYASGISSGQLDYDSLNVENECKLLKTKKESVISQRSFFQSEFFLICFEKNKLLLK